MSQEDSAHVSMGDRILFERKRLGFSQDHLAELGGISKRSYCNYEAGDREIGAYCLELWAKHGIDVQFIVTGIRSTQALSLNEHDLVARYRKAPSTVKALMMGLVAGLSLSEVMNDETLPKQ